MSLSSVIYKGKHMARFPRHIGLLLAAGWSTRFNGDKRLAGATPLLMQDRKSVV